VFFHLQFKLNIKQKNFSIFSQSSKIDTYFMSDFSDTEPSFIIAIYKSNKNKLGCCVLARFKFELHV